jgi:hypothetical protein
MFTLAGAKAATNSTEFLTAKQFAVGVNPTAVATADFNGDGKQDLAVSNLNSGYVTILLGKGDGTFQAAKKTPAVPRPAGVVSADFNNDGKFDLATIQSGGAKVDVLLGNGDGTFQNPTTFTAVGGCTSLLSGDFNGDHNSDLAAGCSSGITVFLGNGNGTFQAAKTVVLGAGAPIAAADVNTDGKLDLLVPGGSPNSSVSVLLGNGDGTFQSAKLTPALADPLSVSTGDFNRDGKMDLVVGNGGFAGVSLLIGNGDGTFQAASPGAPIGAEKVVSLTAADFNGDGVTDLAGAGGSANGTVIYQGNGSNTLTGPVYYGTSVGAVAITSVDLNGDNKMDLVVVNTSGDVPHGTGSVSVILGNGNGFFQGGRAFPVGGGTCASPCSTPSVGTADFNRDGFIDLVAANQQNNLLELLLGNGDATFQGHLDFALTGSMPDAVAIADFNKDGNMDVAVSNQCTPNVTCDSSAGSITLLIGNGNATFQPALDISTGGQNPVWLVAADFNNDGNMDLGVSAAGDCSMKVLLGNGTGSFAAPISSGLPSCGNGMLVTADFNADGNMDIAVVEPNAFAVLLGNGDGTFQPGLSTVSAGVESLSAADFNNDNKMDLAASEGKGANVFLGNGNGTFQAAKFSAADNLADSVVADDFNGDGKIDLALGASPSVDVLLGNGDGTFKAFASYGTGGQAYTGSGMPLLAADYNRDGVDDIVVAYGQTAVDSNLFEILVNAGGTKVTLTSSKNPSNFGQTVTFTSKVTASGTLFGRPSPTGSVTFMDGATVLGTVPLTGGTAAFATATLAVGAHSLTAVYSGDANYNKNTSPLLTQTVNKAATATSLTSAPNPSTFGQTVSFTATVASTTSGTPTGTVTFKDGSKVIGSATLNGSGVGVFMTSSLARGTHSITSVYKGDTNYNSSTSAPVQQVVN